MWVVAPEGIFMPKIQTNRRVHKLRGSCKKAAFDAWDQPALEPHSGCKNDVFSIGLRVAVTFVSECVLSVTQLTLRQILNICIKDELRVHYMAKKFIY